MNFATFIDFLNCLFIDEVEAATKHNNRERFARMVFEGTFEGDLNDPMLAESNRRQAMRSVKLHEDSMNFMVSLSHFDSPEGPRDK